MQEVRLIRITLSISPKLNVFETYMAITSAARNADQSLGTPQMFVFPLTLTAYRGASGRTYSYSHA
jgi:hypothetical protein